MLLLIFFDMCLHPISMRSVDAFGCNVINTFPCGKCIECLKDKQNSWKIRLVEESRDHLYTYFFTLTYRDSTISKVPYSGEFTTDDIKAVLDHDGFLYDNNKSDVQKWIKRNRISYERYFGRKIDFKYFICSEYGPNTGRPHYHGIIFTDISPTFISSMFSDWSTSFGYTNFSKVGCIQNKSFNTPSAVSNYVAKYCAKSPSFFSPVEIEIQNFINLGILSKVWYIMSKGIGQSYVSRLKRYHVPLGILSPDERVSVVCDRAFYHEGSFKYKLPRYYRDRLYRKKFPCDAQIWNFKLMQYENKTFYRYKSKNLLSLQMQAEIRNRVLAEYHRRFAEMRSQYPSLSDVEIDIKLLRSEETLKKSRQKDIYSKLSRFYNSNRFKNKRL